MLRIGEGIGQKEPAGLLCRSVRLRVGSRLLGEGDERLSDSWREPRRRAAGAMVRRPAASSNSMSIGYRPSARIRAIASKVSVSRSRSGNGKRRVDVAIHHVDQKARISKLDAVAWRSASMSFASRRFSRLQTSFSHFCNSPFPSRKHSVKVAPDASARRTQHGCG